MTLYVVFHILHEFCVDVFSAECFVLNNFSASRQRVISNCNSLDWVQIISGWCDYCAAH